MCTTNFDTKHYSVRLATLRNPKDVDLSMIQGHRAKQRYLYFGLIEAHDIPRWLVLHQLPPASVLPGIYHSRRAFQSSGYLGRSFPKQIFGPSGHSLLHLARKPILTITIWTEAFKPKLERDFGG